MTESAIPLFNPRRDQWHEHFTWVKNYFELAGLTPVGRITVERLKVNREVYRRQRGLLRAAARGGGAPWP